MLILDLKFFGIFLLIICSLPFAFRILLEKERLSIEDLERYLGVDKKTGIEILEKLVEEDLARWIEEDAVGLYPLLHYLSLTEEDKKLLRRLLKR